MQKQKQGNPTNKPTDTSLTDDKSLRDAASKGNDIVKRLEEASAPKKKRGRWVECCGVREWVEY